MRMTWFYSHSRKSVAHNDGIIGSSGMQDSAEEFFKQHKLESLMTQKFEILTKRTHFVNQTDFLRVSIR